MKSGDGWYAYTEDNTTQCKNKVKKKKKKKETNENGTKEAWNK